MKKIFMFLFLFVTTNNCHAISLTTKTIGLMGIWAAMYGYRHHELLNKFDVPNDTFVHRDESGNIIGLSYTQVNEKYESKEGKQLLIKQYKEYEEHKKFLTRSISFCSLVTMLLCAWHHHSLSNKKTTT